MGAGIEGFQRGHETYYYHQDEQLSTALLTNNLGEVQNHYQYDAFGDTTEKVEGIPNRIQYTNQQYDTVTGQYYLRARYYNPILGRFLQEDVYQGDGQNLYAYCGNNPVMYYDPSGYVKKTLACPKAQVGGDGNVEPDIDLPSRNGAFRDAKRDAKVPINQQPQDIQKVEMREPEYKGGHVIKDKNGKVIMTREYYYNNTDGETIVIQDHSAGHETGGEGSHFNVRPVDDTRNGSFEGTKPHYPFKK